MKLIELKATCDECETELSLEVVYRTFGVELIIKPCEICMTSEREAGYEEGNSAGYDAGVDVGYAEAMDEVETKNCVLAQQQEKEN